MADDKQGGAPSFTRLIRGGSQQPPASSTPTKSSILQSGPLKKEEEKRRKPILLSFPKAGDAADNALFSIGYKEWGFLLGAVALLFGGMGLVRVFSPKDAPVTPAFDVPPSDFDEASRPPDGSEPSEEVVSSAMKARDTTRLVQAPSDMMPKAAAEKKDKSPRDQLKESFWSGMKEAEKGAAKPPRMPGMFGALNSLMGGGGSGGQPPSRIMSPDEIASRISNIPRGPGRGNSGMRLGYTGGQQIPSFGGQKRVREESSKDAYRAAKQKGADSMGKFSGQPEKQAAEAAAKFGEGAGGSSANQGPEGGASMGGGTPQQDNAQPANVNYKIGRDPIADMVAQEWIKENMRRTAAIWDSTYGSAWKVAGEAIGTVGKSVFDFMWGACDDPVPMQMVGELPAGTFLAKASAGGCAANLEKVTIIGVEPIDGHPDDCNVRIRGFYKSKTTGGEKDTEQSQIQETSCRLNNISCDKIKPEQKMMGGGGRGIYSTFACRKESKPEEAPVASAATTSEAAQEQPTELDDTTGSEQGGEP